MGRLASLYPEDAANLEVSTRLPVPRFPDAARVRNDKDAKSFYGDRLVALYDVAGSDDRLGIVDKLFPHSRFDSMLLAANDRIRASTVDLAPECISAVFELAHGFVRYVSRTDITERFDLHDAEVHVCFNYDPDTIDRDNAMFYDKRFHLHLNCWPAYDLAGIEAVRYGDVTDPLARRRLVDPVAFLAADIISELAGGSIAGHRLFVDDADLSGAPIGLKVRLAGWGAFREPSTHHLLRSLHEIASVAYAAIREAFVGTAEVGQPWTRPCLLSRSAITANIDRIKWLSARSRMALNTLADVLRDVPDEEMETFRHNAVAATLRLTLAGLDYSIGCYSPRAHSSRAPMIDAPEVILTMQCRLFGDVGGAGLPPLRGLTAVRLDRHSGPVMTDHEVKQRTAFRDGFIDDEVSRMVIDGRLRPVGRED